MTDLAGKTILITGASRGIGRAIALRAAADGANVVVAAKTDAPHPRLPGTIHTVVREIEEAGGRALAVRTDVRDDAAVEAAVTSSVETFGGLDALVANASAIQLTGTLDTSMRRFDLMWAVNARATFACSRAALPHLVASPRAHILVLAPPPTLDPRWFAPHCAYTISKLGMSLCVLGLAEEFRATGVGINALWPRTVIATAALRMLGGGVDERNCRHPEIVADAAHAILVRDPRTTTGRFFVDEDVLRETGVTDFDRYAVDPGAPLATDLFLAAATSP